MFAFPAALRIYVAVEPVDMRKQSNGLWAHAEQTLGENPKSGALFVFANKSRDRLKILYWDGTGVWLLAKRLEQGRFSWPQSARGEQPPQVVRLAVSKVDRFDRRAGAERLKEKRVAPTIMHEAAAEGLQPAVDVGQHRVAQHLR